MSLPPLIFAILGLAVALALIIFRKMDEYQVQIKHFTSAKKLDERVRLRAIELVEKATNMPAYLCDDEDWNYAIEQAEIEVWDMVMPEEERRAYTTNRPTKEESFDPWDRVKPGSLMICYLGTSIKEAKKIIARGEFEEGDCFYKQLIDAFQMGGDVIFEIACPRDWWEDRVKIPPHVWVTKEGESMVEEAPDVFRAKIMPEGHEKWEHIIEDPLKTNCVISIKEYSINTILDREEIRAKVYENNCS